MTDIRDVFERYGLELTEEETGKFSEFLRCFVEYNAHTNLSAIREADAIVEKHFVDSLMIERFFDVGENRILDIGTGGGFPGIPLAIVHPETPIVLMDSVGKKIKACKSFIRELGLENVSTVNARAESLAKEKEFREKFTLVVSRATAGMAQILEWSAPFVAPGGNIVLYKIASPEEFALGLTIAKRLRLKLLPELTYELAGQRRTLYVFERKPR
jgi:16S rRNA (guanine527-N7)-methyltransferase